MSRNFHDIHQQISELVTPRERRVSRNGNVDTKGDKSCVTPRERRVSRNKGLAKMPTNTAGHASREACE